MNEVRWTGSKLKALRIPCATPGRAGGEVFGRRTQIGELNHTAGCLIRIRRVKGIYFHLFYTTEYERSWHPLLLSV